MSLAIFDLDNTLLAGDSDYLWGRFLARQGIVDGVAYEQANQRYFDDYKAGRLDIHDFLAFSLQPLTLLPRNQLDALHVRFMREEIEPRITPQARALVDQHRERQDTLLVITATNSFITGPISLAFGIPNLLATEPEIVDGRFTGKVSGTPCFREGKVHNLHRWLEHHAQDLHDSWFYSDSHNDLPLLYEVSHPVAVNPDEQLRRVAEQHAWPILDLHPADDSR